GTAVATYTLTGSCGTATARVTLTVGGAPTVAAIAGADTVCTGTSATLTNATAGGTWSSANPAIASISSSGLVRGSVRGSTTISYTVAAACGSVTVTKNLVVDSIAAAPSITGADSLCAGTTTILSGSIPGGLWASGTPGVAAVSTSGVVTGNAAGTAVITYTTTNRCGSTYTTHTVSVGGAPAAGIVVGLTSLCEGATTTLSPTISGGSWGSSNPAVAAVGVTGVVTGSSAGSALISYTVSNTCGSNTVVTPVTINPKPYVPAITGPGLVGGGATITLNDAATGGNWSSSDNTIATISTSGNVTGVNMGTATITYLLYNTFGCSGTAIHLVTVTSSLQVAPIAASQHFELFPNPATGSVTIAWDGLPDGDATLTLSDITGKIALQQALPQLSSGQVTLPVGSLASGVYWVRITGAGAPWVTKLVVSD
ncbi:MAG: T9SS C-terminal target domain-containing protein, partial [Chitinophagia bacterium]|nr:T9SS C-terminal target domain-containing protein [Chitinophagia bacterium]